MDSVKYGQLDGLRGAASLAVVFSHFINAFFPVATGVGLLIHSNYDFVFNTFPFTFLFGGHFAVCIFFVLSGFVLSIKYFRKPSASIPVDSSLRRYSRLMLPALGSVLFAYVLMKLGLMYNNQASEITGSTSWFSSFWNFLPTIESALREGAWGAFIDGLQPGMTTYNSSLWTMQIELAGSFMVFAFLAIFGSVKRRWLAYLMIMLITWGTYYLPFILGVMISDLTVNRKNIINIVPRSIYPLIILFALYLGGWPTVVERGSAYYFIQSSSLESYLNTSIVLVAHTLGAFLLVVSTIQYDVLGKILTLKPFKFLGRISFSLYLLHLPLIGSFSSILFINLIKYFSYEYSVLIDVAVSLVLFLVVSYAYTLYVDEKAIDLSHRFGNWLKGQVTAKR